MLDIDHDFKKFFPNLDFELRDFQKKTIEHIVEKGNTLCIMPTGSGKSVVYWMAAVEMKGITLVIAPLTALIEEQAIKIEEHGYSTLVLHSQISAKKQMELLTKFVKGEINPDFIFASPEKIATDGFFEYCLKQRKEDIKLVVVDEVHCVSQWGISFRPFYKHIPDFMDELYGKESWARVLALTATLNPKELKDICDAFKITKKNILKQDILIRSEIQLHVLKFGKEDEKEAKFWEIVKLHSDEKILIYVYRKKGERAVEGLCQSAIAKGYKAAWFHGEMSAFERMDIIEQYKTGQINIVFATNAFGMGIDIPDIRVVIHFMIPESAEQYYQEIGRAARDGQSANAYLLYSDKNIKVKHTHFIDRSFPTESKLQDTFKKIGKRPGIRVLPYFDNEDIQECLPYYLNCGLIRIVCKGFSGLSELYDIADQTIQQYVDSTPGKAFVKTVKKNSITPQELASKIYGALLNGKVKTKKALERWLVINVSTTEISEQQMRTMLDEIEEKESYKHELLNYFIYVLDNSSNSQYLHQEIAGYLGMDKYQLGRIYQSNDGNYVRSKSELIICELLAKAKIKYKYEELLEYEPGRKINPDFTIYLANGRKIFWEHVGMLGSNEYDQNWSKKMEIYREFFPDQLYKTYESGALSKDAEKIIEELKHYE